MTLSRVEHALGMVRSYLVERATQNDWDNHGTDELAKAIAVCLRPSAEEPRQAAPRHDRKLSRDLLRRAIRFVNENLDSKLKWDEIASDIGLDPFSFGRGFKLSTGMTPHQYVIRCRLRRAMRLLRFQELTLADVALEVGCSCQSHLTTLFRRHLGTTPGAFRASAGGNPQRIARTSATTPSTIADQRTLVRRRIFDKKVAIETRAQPIARAQSLGLLEPA